MAHILKTTTAGVLIATLAGIDTAQAIEFDVNGAKVKVYGYVKADLFGDLDTDLGTTTFGFSTLAPGFPRNSTSRAQAIQSRLGVITTTETQMGTITTRLEGDSFGGSRRLNASLTQGKVIGSYFVFGGADVGPLGNAI